MGDDIMNKSMVVYLITNTVNGKKYVGQTQRILKQRLKDHRTDKKRTIGIAIKKYGWENFTVEILDECETLEQLYESEKYWIAMLNTKAPNGYNMTDGGIGISGFTYTSVLKKNVEKPPLTPEQRRQFSEAAPNRCEVLCVETGEVFPSISAAARWAGVDISGVLRAAGYTDRTAGGYHWCYAD